MSEKLIKLRDEYDRLLDETIAMLGDPSRPLDHALERKLHYARLEYMVALEEATNVRKL
jgi:hypothetical protein